MGLLDTEYIDTPLTHYRNEVDRVLSPWLFFFIISGLVAGIVWLK